MRQRQILQADDTGEQATASAPELPSPIDTGSSLCTEMLPGNTPATHLP